MTDSSPKPLLSEHENRNDFVGLNIIDTATGKVEHLSTFTADEIDMPGYIESVEAGYRGTQWHTQRVWRADLDTTRDANSEGNIEKN